LAAATDEVLLRNDSQHADRNKGLLNPGEEQDSRDSFRLASMLNIDR
jgi:hypothetical protein